MYLAFKLILLVIRFNFTDFNYNYLNQIFNLPNAKFRFLMFNFHIICLKIF